MITDNYFRFHYLYLYLYLYPVLMMNAWSVHLQIIHVLRFHHSPGGLVGNSGCSSVHLSASVSLSLLPATSRVYFSFLFSSPRLSFSLLGAFSSSHIRDIFLQFTIIIPIILIGDTCTSPSSFHLHGSPSHWSILIISALLLIGAFSSSQFSFSFLHTHHLISSGASFCYHRTNSPSSFYLHSSLSHWNILIISY